MPYESAKKYAWVQYALIPILLAVYPMISPQLDKLYGTQKVTQEELEQEVHDEVHSVVKNAEEIEYMKTEMETYVTAFRDTLATITLEIDEWNKARSNWRENRSLVLKYNATTRSYTYAHPDGNMYPVLWNNEEYKWPHYVKDGTARPILYFSE